MIFSFWHYHMHIVGVGLILWEKHEFARSWTLLRVSFVPTTTDEENLPIDRWHWEGTVILLNIWFSKFCFFYICFLNISELTRLMKLKCFHFRFMRQLMKLADQFGIAVVITNQVRNYRLMVWHIQSPCKFDVSRVGEIAIYLVQYDNMKIWVWSRKILVHSRVTESGKQLWIDWEVSPLAKLIFHELAISGWDQFNMITIGFLEVESGETLWLII